MEKKNLINKVSFIFKNKKILFLYFFAIFIISSFIELISLSLIIPFILLISNPSFLIGEYSFMNLNFSFSQSSLTISIITFLLVKYLLMLYINYYIPKFAYTHQRELRIRILKNFFSKNYLSNSNELVQLTLGTLQIFTSQFIISLLKIASSVLILSFVTIYLILFDPFISFFLIILFALIFLFYNFYLKNRFKLFGQIVINSSENIILGTTEIYKGFQEITIYDKTKFFLDKLSKFGNELSSAEIKTRFLINLPRFFLEVIVLFSLFSIVLIYPDQTSHENSILSIGVFGFAALRIIPALTECIAHLNNIKYANKTVDTIYNSIKNEKNSTIRKKSALKNDLKEIQIKNLSYKYPKNNQKIINNLSFKIKKGETVGIVGQSGSGKSTLVKIILGLIKPSKGTILYNGLNKKIQNISSYIPQDIFVIRGSVRENITLTSEKNENQDKQIWSSLQRSGLYNFIQSKKEKLSFIIEDEGNNLSGGQKQRIAVARAIFHKKDLIVLDEATSSLDLERENKILKDLHKDKKLTKIIISHKKNIRNYCNKVIEFKNLTNK
tara:strand:+ start:21742 stop:23406 length:1665 start_codon:yes stop_codon:yes gene_type:complete